MLARNEDLVPVSVHGGVDWDKSWDYNGFVVIRISTISTISHFCLF